MAAPRYDEDVVTSPSDDAAKTPLQPLIVDYEFSVSTNAERTYQCSWCLGI